MLNCVLRERWMLSALVCRHDGVFGTKWVTSAASFRFAKASAAGVSPTTAFIRL